MCASIFSILTVKGPFIPRFAPQIGKNCQLFRQKCQAPGLHGLPPLVHGGPGHPQGVLGRPGGARHQGRGGLLPRPHQQSRGDQIR